MIIVAGTIDLAPADREAFLAFKADQVAHSRTEAGCLDYVFSADASDPGRIRLFERWEDEATLNAHVEHIQANPRTEPVTVLAREFKIFDATPK